MLQDDSVTNINILIDLDCVLDTRHPVLYALDKSTSLEVLKGDYYRKRVRDSFGIIPTNVFTTFYNKRNKQVLELAAPTPLFELVKGYCTEAYTMAMSGDKCVVPTLYINIHPYELNKTEVTNLIMLWNSVLDVNINIEIIDKSNVEILPKFISNEISIFIKYDMLNWLEYHTAIGELSKCSLLAVSCVAPLLANGHKVTTAITQDDFEELRKVFAPITNLVLLQSRMFSLI